MMDHELDKFLKLPSSYKVKIGMLLIHDLPTLQFFLIMNDSDKFNFINTELKQLGGPDMEDVYMPYENEESM